MCRDFREKIPKEFVLASPAVPCISCFSYLNDLLDGRQVAVQMPFCGMLLQGFVQECTQSSCVVPIKLFLYML